MSRRELGFGDFMLFMTERCESEPARRNQAVDCLRQIDEAFGGRLDPAGEFEAYAAWRFRRAVRRVLEAGR